MPEECYNPPGRMPLLALAELLMRQERWGWSKALYEAMVRRERAYQRRLADQARRQAARGGR